jgi:multidrug resistance efflux pump
MASWLIPALKAVLPHVGTIISAATPVFTKKKADAANPGPLLQQQISELQAAASQNAANIKELAAQLQSTVAALEQAALKAEANLKQMRVYCAAAMVLSIIALSTALLLVVTR